MKEEEEFSNLAVEATRVACDLHFSMIGAYKRGANAEDLAQFEGSIERLARMHETLMILLGGPESSPRANRARVA
ncbi:MAG TPA: hypothetical protein VJX67_14235 [Blastocatellia bacterium]|nr:hypothetical protein [Blastocatellia bacterium]